MDQEGMILMVILRLFFHIFSSKVVNSGGLNGVELHLVSFPSLTVYNILSQETERAILQRESRILVIFVTLNPHQVMKSLRCITLLLYICDCHVFCIIVKAEDAWTGDGKFVMYFASLLQLEDTWFGQEMASLSCTLYHCYS